MDLQPGWSIEYLFGAKKQTKTRQPITVWNSGLASSKSKLECYHNIIDWFHTWWMLNPFPDKEKPHQQLIGATWHNASPGDGDVDEYCGNCNNLFEVVYIYDPSTCLLCFVTYIWSQFRKSSSQHSDQSISSCTETMRLHLPVGLSVNSHYSLSKFHISITCYLVKMTQPSRTGDIIFTGKISKLTLHWWSNSDSFEKSSRRCWESTQSNMGRVERQSSEKEEGRVCMSSKLLTEI